MNFKVGDRVRRIRGTHNGMKVGDEATIKLITPLGLQLKEFYQPYGVHSASSFELVLPAIPTSRLLELFPVPIEFASIGVDHAEPPCRCKHVTAHDSGCAWMTWKRGA